MGSEITTGFDCETCNRHHDIFPLSFSVKAPRAATLIPADELEHRVILTPDQCLIDGKDFYLRGRIPIPILDYPEPFIWGVWAEVSPKDFIHTIGQWKTPGREAAPPFRGWLASDIALFRDTLNLEVAIHTQAVGKRPRFTLKDARHPLAIEQRTGINLRRAQEIAELMLHK